MTSSVQLAQTFADLHRAGAPLLLPNAWDVGSAVATVSAGAQAVATTSAGVAWSLGVADGAGLGGAGLGAERLAAVVGRIAAAVPVPVSADIEGGYGTEPATVAATVRAVVQAGAVGINIEDAPGRDGLPLLEPAEHAQRLAAARGAADALGVPVWINARTDVFLRGSGPLAQRLDDVKARAGGYAAAGADSLFVPGLVDLDAIAELARGPLPVAVMVWAGAPPVSDLAAAGAVRISLGSAIAQAAYALAARATTEMLTTGRYDATTDAIPYDEMNAAFVSAVRAGPPA